MSVPFVDLSSNLRPDGLVTSQFHDILIDKGIIENGLIFFFSILNYFDFILAFFCFFNV